VNQINGLYSNGIALPQINRERILDLHHQGMLQRAIAEYVRVSVGFVNKVVIHYEENNTFLPQHRKAPVREKLTVDVVEYIESEKICKPSSYTREIQQRVLLDGVSAPHNLPSQSAIKKYLREDCVMTKMKYLLANRIFMSSICLFLNLFFNQDYATYL